MLKAIKAFFEAVIERLKRIAGSQAWSDNGRRSERPKLTVKRGGRIDRHLRQSRRHQWPPGAA